MLLEFKSILSQLDLNANDTKVFVAAFELGYAPASAIAKQANLNRITAYEALKRLGKKGLVKTRAKTGSGIKYFEVEDMGILKDSLQAKKASIERSLSDLEVFAVQLREQYAGRSEKPAVLFYEGRNGIKNVLLDTLNQKPKEILSFASADVLESGYEWHFLETYWKSRVDLKIPSRGIMPKTQKAVSFFTDERNMRELRRVHFVNPEGYIFKNEIDIYGDNISIISLSKGNEHGVIIRSRNIAEGLRSIFQLVWG
jgi:sugar-specific transcriptional regulator TrmB